MFKYSARPGTKAAEYTDQISEEIKQSRLETLIEFQQKITDHIQKSVVFFHVLKKGCF